MCITKFDFWKKLFKIIGLNVATVEDIPTKIQALWHKGFKLSQ